MECIDPDKIAELIELAGEAESDWIETLIRQFLGDSADRVEKLRAAYRSGDGRTVEEVAHALKGSSATMGASRMKRIADRLQSAGRSPLLEGADLLIEDLAREFDLARRHLEGILAGREEHR